jgi:hypothetical protein
MKEKSIIKYSILKDRFYILGQITSFFKENYYNKESKVIYEEKQKIKPYNFKLAELELQCKENFERLQKFKIIK